MKRPRWCRSRTWTAFLVSLAYAAMLEGCGLTLGPTVQREFILVKPGQPVLILSNAKVRGQRLDDGSVVDGQQIGGWVAMPREHWEILQPLLTPRP